MESPVGYNVYNTAFMPPKVMVYFEHHQIIELGLELVNFMNIHRPHKDHLEQFIHEHLKNIASNYSRSIGLIITPPQIGPHQIANKYNEMFKSPIIQYTKRRRCGDVPRIIKKLNEYLRHYEIEHKDLMIFNLPGNRDEALTCRQFEFNPNFVLELKIPQNPEPMCTNPARDGYQIKTFYNDKYCAVIMPPSLEAISRKIHSKFRNFAIPETALGKYVPRVVMIGRRGSGRKLQANLLCREFDLVYIDVEYLLLKYLQSNSPLGNALECGYEMQNYSPELLASILLSRLLEPDCLANGWVIVGFPNTRKELELIVSNDFIVPPNKIIFLHTRERVCLRRLAKKAECSCYLRLCDNIVYIRKEFEFFNLHIRNITAACETRKETIHIDGNHSTNTVKTNIWGRVLQSQRF